MNPLSSMGRGVRAQRKLASAAEQMRRIAELTAPFDGRGLEIIHIRFPNAYGKPLAGCEAGTIIYVFAAGKVTVCPYLVFAARTPQSRHEPAEFIVGNVFTDPDIARRLDDYPLARLQMGTNPTCRSCDIEGQCGKGCPAAVIAAGERIGAVDAEVCPVSAGTRAPAAAGYRMKSPGPARTGLFVSIDGPGGVGKSTLAATAARELTARGLQIHLTREPSPTPLGEIIRSGTGIYRGMALACLVAGDRHHHLSSEIRPHRDAGEIVLCDRYLPSSLVLQRIDGIDWQTIVDP